MAKKAVKKIGAARENLPASFLPADTVVVVLNLDERTDRLEQVSAELKRIGLQWERFPAIKHETGWMGYNLSIQGIFEKYRDRENILIIEDDCQFIGDESLLPEVIKQLPDGWDGFWFGSNLQSEHIDQVAPNLFRLENGWNTHATIFSRKFRSWILERWNASMLVFDEWIRVNALGANQCYVAYPLLAIQRPSKSDIVGGFADYSEVWKLAQSRMIVPVVVEETANSEKEIEIRQTSKEVSSTTVHALHSRGAFSPVSRSRGLNILFNLHSYIPEQMSGAEVMTHRMARYLVEAGHEVTVLTKWDDKVVDGVRVKKWSRLENWPDQDSEEFKRADIVFTHLGQTQDTINKCIQHRKKLVHIVHNTFKMFCVDIRTVNHYCVFNSQWARETIGYKHPGVILNPPVDYREFLDVDRKKAECVTLVNVNENKGGRIFPEIAKKLPGLKFLGVDGGYEQQIRDMSVKNIRYVPQHPDIKDILKQTRILLMPSNYESWGLIAIEAAACGIPVIANPTPGLKSSLGDAGIWVEREDIDGWAREITSLQDAKAYAEASARSLARAKELDPLPQLEAMEQFLQWIHKQPYQ